MLKKIYAAAVSFTILLSLCFVGYGMYINMTSAKNIAERMRDMALTLYGAVAEYRDINPIYECSYMMLYPSSATDVISKIDGVVRKVNVQDNDTVHERDVLFELENENFPLYLKEIESNLLKAESVLIEAETSLERASNLLRSSAISKREHEHAQLNLDMAKAEVEALNAKKARTLNDVGAQIVEAPYDGRVLSVYKDRGTFVSAGTPLLAVGKPEVMTFENRMPDDEVQRIISGDIGYFVSVSDGQIADKITETRNRDNAHQDKRIFAATVAEIHPRLTTPSQFRTVRWEVDNSSRLLSPGIYENVLIFRDSPMRALVIPKRAFADDRQNLVHSLDTNEMLIEKSVVVGAEDEFYAEILSGLEAGERVVISDVSSLIEGENKITLIIEK